MANKKYEFTDETKVIFGITFHRIRALISFGIVKKGELGGWIEKEGNLNHSDNAWVSGNAQVSGDAQVYGNAWVSGNARVYGDAWVSGNARVYGNAQVSGDAQVYGNAQVYGDAWASGNARVYGNAWVSGNAWVYGNAQVSGDAQVYGNAWVYGDAWVSGNARVYGNAQVFWISKIGSRLGTTTFFLCADKKIRASCGCFYGDLEKFAAKVEKTHGDNRHGKVYRLAIEMAKAHIVIPAEGEGEDTP